MEVVRVLLLREDELRVERGIPTLKFGLDEGYWKVLRKCIRAEVVHRLVLFKSSIGWHSNLGMVKDADWETNDTHTYTIFS